MLVKNSQIPTRNIFRICEKRNKKNYKGIVRCPMIGQHSCASVGGTRNANNKKYSGPKAPRWGAHEMIEEKIFPPQREGKAKKRCLQKSIPH
ncbi:hypothetical protein EBR57_07455 [bacterium]|nr:hypothetical protein [bacterium]